MAQDKDLYYLVELYTPKARWHALPAAERQAFLAAVGGALTELAALGVHVISLAPTEAGIDHGSPHRFLGIWSFPDRAVRDALLAGIAASGWYDYFDHVNAASAAGDAAAHLADLQQA